MPVTTSRKKSNGQAPDTWPDEDVNEYEQVIAGGVVRGVDLGPLRGVIDPNDFADSKLGAVVRAGLRLEAEGQPRDNITLGGELRKMPRGLNDGGTWFDLVGSATLINLFNACPSELAFPAYVERLADVIERRKGGLVVERQLSIEVKRAGLGYEAAVQSSVTLRVDGLRESHGELTGELSVRWTSPRRSDDDGHIYRGRFNLSSLAARSSTARFLAEATRGAELPWPRILERFCVGVLADRRRPSAVIDLASTGPRPTAKTLIGPMLPVGQITTLMAMEGTGKTTLVRRLVVSLTTGVDMIGWKASQVGPVLVLDYEADEYEWADGIAEICAGVGCAVPQVDYMGCAWRGALYDQIESIVAEVDRIKPVLVVLDSAELAAGVGNEGESFESRTQRLYAALKLLSTTVLVIDHLAATERDGSGPASKAYGSIFKMAWSRQVWELKREKAPTDEHAELLLLNTKYNAGARAKPIGLAFSYRLGQLTVERMDVLAPELQGSLPVHERMARLVRGGALTVATIAKDLEKTEAYVRQLVSRYKDRFIRLPDGRIGLVGHV